LEKDIEFSPCEVDVFVFGDSIGRYRREGVWRVGEVLHTEWGYKGGRIFDLEILD